MTYPVNGYSGGVYPQGYEQYYGYQQPYPYYTVPGDMPMDQVQLTNQTQKKRGFSVLNAGWNLAKGAVINPIKSLFSVGGIASMAAAGGLVAVFGAPAALGLAAVGLGLGGMQLGRGGFNFVSNYFKGDMDKAEQAFEDIGSGGATALLSGKAFSGLSKGLNFKPFGGRGKDLIKLPFIKQKLNPKAFTSLFSQAKQNAISSFQTARNVSFRQLGSGLSQGAVNTIRKGKILAKDTWGMAKDAYNGRPFAGFRTPVGKGLQASVQTGYQNGKIPLYGGQAGLSNTGSAETSYDVAV